MFCHRLLAREVSALRSSKTAAETRFLEKPIRISYVQLQPRPTPRNDQDVVVNYDIQRRNAGRFASGFGVYPVLDYRSAI
jgi:hypothetical protein